MTSHKGVVEQLVDHYTSLMGEENRAYRLETRMQPGEEVLDWYELGRGTFVLDSVDGDLCRWEYRPQNHLD